MCAAIGVTPHRTGRDVRTAAGWEVGRAASVTPPRDRPRMPSTHMRRNRLGDVPTLSVK